MGTPSKSISKIVVKGALLLGLWNVLIPKNSEAADQNVRRAYLLTSTYGVLVGTLTGIASLAFYSEPGQNKKNIAIGASLGLYTGILLGTYVLFLAPDPNAPKTQAADPEDEEAYRGPIFETPFAAAGVQLPRFQPHIGYDPQSSSVYAGISYVF
jgi:hypothetical protein